MQSTTAYRPITQTCALTGTPFTITPEDQAFYERIAPVFNGVKYQIPLPTLCPDARQQRRMAWRGKDYFFRPCSKTGKQCLSIYPPDVEMVGYCEEAHEADDWDGTEWGRDIDFTRPFFEQFIELWRSTPKQLSNTYSSDNCSYVINANRNKDCYLVDELDRCRECLYGYCVQDCANVVNGFYARKSNFCYEVSQVEDCYEVFYSHNVHGSSNCAFIKNCRNITNALFCCNLRNKNGDDYYMFNELVSKEAFEEAWNYVFAGKQEHITQSKQRFEQFLQTQTMPAAILTNSEHCIGDQISNSQNCNSCFNIDNCQDCSYCTDIHNSKDVYDCHIYEGEIMIDCLHAGPEGYAQYFSHTPWYSSNVFYCSHLLSCQDCFGCSGMKHKEYCILNKQYSKEEYETLVGKLIEHMQATGEWGEFFSANLSPYGYNQTMASYYFPLVEQQAQSLGFNWANAQDSYSGHDGIACPDDLANVDDDITDSILISGTGNAKYKIVKPELAFHRKYNIPLPTLAPMERIEQFVKQNGRTLYKRECGHCQKAIETTYAPTRPETIFCNSCYLKEVY